MPRGKYIIAAVADKKERGEVVDGSWMDAGEYRI
jgi:hypothetical protein